jgi:proteasome accessory factor A
MKAKNKQDRIGGPPRKMLPKLCGADIELGNFTVGKGSGRSTGGEASRALLREIDGLPRRTGYYATGYSAYQYKTAGYDYEYGGYGYNPQDWGRKWLTNGSCVYIDLDHLELCLPEVISAYDHVAAWHAMLRIARRAQTAANGKLPAGQKYQVLINNSDGQDHSYGSHLDFLITRKAWDAIFQRKLHPLLFLAAFQASSIVYTGQGKVGAENGRPPVSFQLTQRADFMETLVSAETTFCRPVVNSRDETLCGRAAIADSASKNMARLHVIFFDNTLCHVASLLKVGVMQIILSMIEAECVGRDLLLDDPLLATILWSRDPTLQARSRMLSGAQLTAVELQLLFLESARKFVANGGCDGFVPRAGEILDLWEDTLVKLKARDFTALAPRLDWVLKLRTLVRAMQQRAALTWDSPEIKHLDHLYSSLDLSDGLYWAYEKADLVERIVSHEQIEHLTQEPPDDTRAYTRAMLLRKAGPEKVDDVDWDMIRLSEMDSGSRWPVNRTVDLADPLAFTRAETEKLFREDASLSEILDALEIPDCDKAIVQSAGHQTKYLN